MKKLKNIILLLVIFFGVPVGLLMFIWKDRCVHTVKSTILSAEGNLQAVIQETDCGVTMAKATVVKLEEKKKNRWDTAGDIIVMQGVQPVAIEWQESDLQVGIPEGAVIVKSRDQIGDTRITFSSVK